MRGGDGGQHLGQGGAVARVAGRDGHLGAERGEFGAQLLGAGGGRALTAEQPQVARAVPGVQVAGEQTAERAGAAGAPDGPLGVEGAGAGGQGRVRPGHEARQP
ncbi:hypothetical protein VM98_37865, partial [Streptomyces rubellomurinus subsp. indigoferus]